MNYWRKVLEEVIFPKHFTDHKLKLNTYDLHFLFKKGYQCYTVNRIDQGPDGLLTSITLSLPTKQWREQMADNTITTKVAEALAGIGPSVEADVISALSDREVKKRSEAIVIVYDKLQKLQSDYKKLGPDLGVYDAAGKETSSGYSKQRIKDRNDLSGKIDKYSKAIEKALAGDCSDIYNLSRGSDKEGGGKDKGTPDSGDSEQGG